MERDELAAWLRLTLTPGVGNATVRKLLAAFGLPQAVFAQSEQTLHQLVSAQQATALLDVPAGLETLAEGVETPGEHALLAQLGCGHVQGYVVAKPMPVEELATWLATHREKRAQALRIGVRAR